MLGTSNDLHAFRETFSGSDARYVEIGAAIGVDYFIARHFSFGLDLGASYADDEGYGVDTFQTIKSRSIGGGARFGYDVPLGHLFSWYPRLTLALSKTHSTTTASAVSGNGPLGSSVSSSVGPVVNLYAPLLLHLVPHLFVGFGPRLNHGFGVQRGGPYEGTQSTFVSGDFVLGGFWGGNEALADSAVGERPTDEAAFGEHGQLVLGLGTDASVSYRTDSAGKSSQINADVTPSVDYFVLDQLSVGVNAFIGHSSGTAREIDDTPRDFASTKIGVGPRVGSSVRLGKWGTFWPQLELGYGTSSTKQSSSEGTNQHFGTRSWLRLSGPVLCDVTSHFLLGAGPYFFHEISNTDQYGFENKGESVGIRLVMAGWF